MKQHSNTLEDTALWNSYCEKIPQDRERITWVEKVCRMAMNYLNDVRSEFKNYTLHDGTHVLNVLDAIGGLLGDYIEKLSAEEMELLILAAALHDIGMVYTEEEKEYCFEDEQACKEFLMKNAAEWIGCASKDWPEDLRQWYLRVLHPFRIFEVLENKEWKEMFAKRPSQIVAKKCIETVCQAHGEEPKELYNNPDLEYLAASDADPLFCALLLRLADLLDFDDTRAPKVLYTYVADNAQSREEWDKHQASAGFRYPASPSIKELPYKACCKNPTIEHSVRKFLDWIDEELENCARLQKYCHMGWRQEFPFPRAVLRSEIESDGYMSGDFCMTMDQERILNLLMGENLYDSRDVFVRELLQNAIDATLLRGEMDSGFMPQQSRIDFWEWTDREGNLWFRIDDRGTGMTLGMLQRYFLKVGNSYYMSEELERDLSGYGRSKDYQSISRFGIGFLSCFLCGNYVEVSTLYFDPEKNRREDTAVRQSQMPKYGLRLEVTGLKGYYTLKNQAERHAADPLPAPDFYNTKENNRINEINGINGKNWIERHGYRAEPGTSVVIRLEPGRLGALSLRETVEKYLCAARMPVYYNNRRVGKTYEEVMQAVHEVAGERVYELNAGAKERFDQCFPAIRGNYPKLVMTVIPLDTEEDQVMPDLSGALVKYDVRFDKEPRWKDKDQVYFVKGHADSSDVVLNVHLKSRNTQDPEFLNFYNLPSLVSWDVLETRYGIDKAEALKTALKKFSSCPKTEDQLGEAWKPFAGRYTLQAVWAAYVNKYNEGKMTLQNDEFGSLDLYSIVGKRVKTGITCIYQGVLADADLSLCVLKDSCGAILLLDGECKPAVEISRSKIVDMSLKLLTAMQGILNKYEMIDKNAYMTREYEMIDIEKQPLTEWRKVCQSSVGRWMVQNHGDIWDQIMENTDGAFERLHSKYFRRDLRVIYRFFLAYLQDHYSMEICYEQRQNIKVYENSSHNQTQSYDLFPPMLFCHAASDQSRRYICHARLLERRGITADHPFMIWLLEHAVQLNQYFHRQFQQIVDCLYQRDASDLIKEYAAVREQLCVLSAHYNLDVSALPELDMDDFWMPEDHIDEAECPF